MDKMWRWVGSWQQKMRSNDTDRSLDGVPQNPKRLPRKKGISPTFEKIPMDSRHWTDNASGWDLPGSGVIESGTTPDGIGGYDIPGDDETDFD